MTRRQIILTHRPRAQMGPRGLWSGKAPWRRRLQSLAGEQKPDPTRIPEGTLPLSLSSSVPMPASVQSASPASRPPWLPYFQDKDRACAGASILASPPLFLARQVARRTSASGSQALPSQHHPEILLVTQGPS